MLTCILPGEAIGEDDEHSMQRIAALLKLRDSVQLSSSQQKRRLHQQRAMLKAKQAALNHEQAAIRARGLNPYEVTNVRNLSHVCPNTLQHKYRNLS